jgi:hypothetical protein
LSFDRTEGIDSSGRGAGVSERSTGNRLVLADASAGEGIVNSNPIRSLF